MNGSQVASATPLVNSNNYVAGNLALGVGGAEADYAELLYYDNRVTDQDAINIDCYLGTRYGTSVCP